MRISRTAFVCLIALSTAANAHAQFGKLKGLADKVNDKMNKPMDVQRKSQGTPEVLPAEKVLPAGQTKDVSITVNRFDTSSLTEVKTSDSRCIQPSDLKIVSANEVTVKLQVLPITEDRHCGITLHSKDGQMLPVSWQIKGIKEPKFEAMMVGSETMFASEWKLILPDGKSDVWKRSSKIDDSQYEYTNTAGQKLKFQASGPMAIIQSDNGCTYTGAFGTEGRAEFYPTSGPCGVPVGSKLKASSK